MNFFLNQARSTVTEEMVGWVTVGPDWSGVSFPGPGSPEYIASTELVGKSVTSGIQFARQISDTIAMIDSVKTGRVYVSGATAPALIILDQIEAMKLRGTGATATASTSDLIGRQIDTNRKIVDTITLSDSISWTRSSAYEGTYLRIVSASIVLVDTLKYTPLRRTITDTLFVNDATEWVPPIEVTIDVTDDVVAELL